MTWVHETRRDTGTFESQYVSVSRPWESASILRDSLAKW